MLLCSEGLKWFVMVYQHWGLHLFLLSSYTFELQIGMMEVHISRTSPQNKGQQSSSTHFQLHHFYICFLHSNLPGTIVSISVTNFSATSGKNMGVSTPSPRPSVYHPLKVRFWPHKGNSFSPIFRGRFAVSGPTGKQQKHKIESNKTHAMIGSFQNVLSKKSFPINIDPKISHEQKRSHMIHMMLSQIPKSPISSVQARNAILSSSHRCIF